MGLPDRTRLKLAAEGLTTPTDFIDFPDKDDLDAFILKCLKPAKIAGGAAANARPREVLQYEIPARSPFGYFLLLFLFSFFSFFFCNPVCTA